MSTSPEPAFTGRSDLAGRCLLVLACCSSVLLMLPVLSAGPLVLDEHVSYWVIDSTLPGSVLTRSLDYAAVPPLASWLQLASVTVFGKSELALRLPSAVCYVLAVPVIYVLGTHLQDRLLGGIAALMLAWHPEALDEVRIARCYGLVLLLSSMVVLTTWYWLQFAKSRKWSVLWTLSAASLLWTHYTSALLVVATAAWIGLRSLQSRQARNLFPIWLLAMIALTLIAAPLIPSVLRLREWGPFLNFMPADQTVWDFIGPFWWLGFPAGLAVSRGISRRIQPADRETGSPRQSPATMLVGCSILPLLLLALLAHGDMPSLANPRYRVAFVPAGTCLAALLLRRSSSWPAAAAGSVVLLISSWTVSPLLPWQLGRLGGSTATEWRGVAEYIGEHSSTDQIVFVQSGLVENRLVPFFTDDAVFLEYTACRAGRFYLESELPRIGLPAVWDVGVGARAVFLDIIHRQQPSGGDFWIAAATDTDLNRNSAEIMRQIAKSAGYSLTDQREWPQSIVERYSSGSTAPR